MSLYWKLKIFDSYSSSMGLKTLYTALLILIRKQPLSAINALSKVFLIPTEFPYYQGAWVLSK